MMPVRRTQNWLPSIFNDFFDNDWMERANATAPAINVIESENDYKIELAAPGMTKKDFNVHIDEDNNLVIAMEKKEQKKEEKKNSRYLRREFSYSKFQQTMILPNDVEKDKITAQVEDGVLTVDIPKRNEEASKIQNALRLNKHNLNTFEL
ncbi:MAG: Hsp20/alpha crystallin family protein [Barnesiella sp.]